MDFTELKRQLRAENEIEREQRIEGYNVNDQHLPYDEEAVPKMPSESFFKEGNIFINKHHRYSEMLTIRMSLWNLIICFPAAVFSM